MIDVAVSLVGTFAVMNLMGFTLNNLTLFGLVLAIGIVVDDAIVVLENIERWLDKGLPVREATIKAMDEITGPIIAITLVLSSVLLPSAFLGGITGQFFRQFALTISVSMIISAINAMTMTPARAACDLRRPPARRARRRRARRRCRGGASPCSAGWLTAVAADADARRLAGPAGGRARAASRRPAGLRATVLTWGVYLVLFLPGAVAGGVLGWLLIRPVNWALGRFFRGFNWVFDRATRAYGKAVGWCLRLSAIVLLVYVGLLGLTDFGFTRIPSGFIPSQDKGYLIVNIQLPDSASLERTVEVTDDGREDRPGNARRRPHGGHPGDVVRPERHQLELRLHVRHPQAVPRAAGPGADRRGHRGPAPRSASGARSRRPACWSSGRRRSAAWATPAASS